jgi:hypothetical protein
MRKKKQLPQPSLAEQVARLEQSDAMYRRRIQALDDQVWHWMKHYADQRMEWLREHNQAVYAELNRVIE